MRNRYRGTCYFCGKTVKPGDGHFERNDGGWRTIHASCVFVQRERKANLQPILSGIRAGKVTAFCNAMGWKVRPYQTIVMMRMMQRARYRQFTQIAPAWTFDKIWEQWHPTKKNDWHAIHISESAFLPQK